MADSTASSPNRQETVGGDPPIEKDEKHEQKGAQRGLTMAEGCRLLGLRPEALRHLLQEFSDQLPSPVRDAGDRRLAADALPLLARIVALRNARAAYPDIVAALREAAASRDAAGPAVAAPPVPDPLVQRLESLQQELRRAEERRAEDRDRLLTALVRTNQEMQQLRFELARRPRRQRRKGWLGQLFG